MPTTDLSYRACPTCGTVREFRTVKRRHEWVCLHCETHVTSPRPPEHDWTTAELRHAWILLPEGLFSSYYFDRIGKAVVGRTAVGLSLCKALERDGLVRSCLVDDDLTPNNHGMLVRYEKKP